VAAVPARAAPDADGIYEVTVLALYAPAVAADFGGAAAVVSEIDRTITLANGIYAFNHVPVRLRLTSVEQFDEAETADDFYASLDQLPRPPLRGLAAQCHAK
jgi:hypothetical protein